MLSTTKRWLALLAVPAVALTALVPTGAAATGDSEGHGWGGGGGHHHGKRSAFTLTILHNNDGESRLLNLGSGLEDFGGAARFATVVRREKIEALADNWGGWGHWGYWGGWGRWGRDHAKHGVVMLSSGDNFLAGPEFAASSNDGIYYDAVALDLIGYDALAIGNHDFDFGPDVLTEFIETYRRGRKEIYLSSNLDFTGEPGLQALFDQGKIAKSTIVRERGERIGIVGATTPNLPFISSPRNVVVDPDVKAAVQAEIDKLERRGVNKIIFISHLQDVEGDIALLAELDGVDVAVAGGGDELLANPDDMLVPGDEGEVFGPYPIIATDMDGTEVPVVTTSGQYGYLGKLVVDFDKHGNVVAIDDESGPIRIAGGDNPDAVEPRRRVERLVTDPVQAFVDTLAEQVIGTSEVALDGTRNNVRSVATNEGNLIADSLVWQAQQLAGEFGVPPADIGLQNGGGIRNDSVIPAGPISELDTFAMVPFPNFLTVTTLSRERVKEILEHAVSCAVAGDPAYGGADSCGSGRYAQVGGMTMTWDSAGTQQQLDEDGNVTQSGTRVQEVALADGTPIVAGGAVVAGDDLTVATIDFLARGGDQYPYRDAAFTVLGASYQQALSNYIQDGLGGTITAADYPEGGGGRIVRL
jgi:5'-nucleotidase